MAHCHRFETVFKARASSSRSSNRLRGDSTGSEELSTMLVATTIQGARDFAMTKHDGQVRKHDGRPYIAHLDGVAAILVEYGHKSADIISAAFLHDTIEKSDTSIEELTEKFGEAVA